MSQMRKKQIELAMKEDLFRNSGLNVESPKKRMPPSIPA